MYRSIYRFTVILAIAAATLSWTDRPGRADILGRFNGFCQNNLLPAVQKPVFFDVFSVQGRRFQGILEIIPCLFPIDGTVEASGHMTGGGVDQHGHRMSFGGRTQLMGDGSVRFAALRYKIWMERGVVEEGHCLLVQMIGGPGWDQMAGADVGGSLFGMHFPDGGRQPGEMDGRLQNERFGRTQPTTAISGGMRFFDVFWEYPPDPIQPGFFDVFLDVHGTVGLPAVQTPIGLIGRVIPSEGNETNGIIAILIGLLLPAVQDQPRMISGRYMLYDSFFDVFTEFYSGRSMSFTQGNFVLPYIEQDN